jgi:chaperone required for assembly of F1-ATPase
LAFLPTEGISPQPQPPETIAQVEFLAAQLDDFRLSAVAFGSALFGSAILSLALERGRLTGEQAFDLSRLDEAFQEEQWGVDEEAAERTANQRAEAIMLDLWLKALS